MRTWINHFIRILIATCTRLPSRLQVLMLAPLYRPYMLTVKYRRPKVIVSVVQRPDTWICFHLQLTGVHEVNSLTTDENYDCRVDIDEMALRTSRNYITHLLGQADAGPAFKQCVSGPLKQCR